jgi:hypothetical protein
MRPVAFPYQTPATSLPTGHSHLPHVSSCTRRVGAFSTGQRGLTPPGTQNVCVCIQSRSPQVRPDSNLRGSERLLLPSAAGHIHLSHTRATLIAPVRTHRDRTFSTQGSGGSRRPAPRIKYVCVQSRSPTRHARDSSNRWPTVTPSCRVRAFSTGQRGLTPPGTQNVCVHPVAFPSSPARQQSPRLGETPASVCSRSHSSLPHTSHFDRTGPYSQRPHLQHREAGAHAARHPE